MVAQALTYWTDLSYSLTLQVDQRQTRDIIQTLPKHFFDEIMNDL